MKNNSRLWMVVVVILLIAGVFLINDSFNDMMAAGVFGDSWASINEVPEITVYDENGTAHNLSDFRGKPVVLHFWGTWSDGSVEGLPALNEMWQTYKDQIQFLFVARPNGSQETMESVQSFLTDNGYTFPVYYDTTLEAGATMQVDSLPITFFIDSEGLCSLFGEGPLPTADLQTGIDDILS